MSIKIKKYPEFQDRHVQEGVFCKLTSDFRQPANSSEPFPLFGSPFDHLRGASRWTFDVSLCLRVIL